MDWSSEQQAIFHAVRVTPANLSIAAAPGSGKTTVAQEIFRQVNDHFHIIYLAFNKNIVEEMLIKLKLSRKEVESQGHAVKTFNSLGAGVCSKYFRGVKLNTGKVYSYIKPLEYKFPEKQRELYKYNLSTAVQYCKSNLSLDVYKDMEGRGKSLIHDLIEYFDLDGYPGMVADVITVLKASNADTQQIDFSDQLLFPCLYDLPLPQYDLCIVDEAQDVNVVQRELLRKLQQSTPQIRFIFVGDSHQAIYGFRGALADSLTVLSEEFRCVSYPLTTTWRCGKQIVEKAQALYPDDIQSHTLSHEGLVRVIPDMEHDISPLERDYTSVIVSEVFTEDSLILCRTVAPLVSFAYLLLRNTIPCQLRGRDIGKSFIQYIKKSQCQYIPDFREYMNNDIRHQIELAVVKKNSNKVQALYDKKETLETFIDNCVGNSIQDLISSIECLFERSKGVLLSSVHKAKGLEADKVYILAPDLMPHTLAKQQWEKVQETNIQYVAITRAKNELVYI